MNDFTKEELEWLYDEIDGVIEQFEYEDKRAYSCQDKLKSMIDNYCEHEWENICCQCTLDKIYCYKCEKDMGDLKE